MTRPATDQQASNAHRLASADARRHGPTERPDLPDAVIDCWGFDIVSGAIPAGTTETADTVAERMGVSRTVVRQAARVLETKGLLNSRRRLGLTVLPPSSWHPLDYSIIRWRLTGPEATDCGVILVEIQLAIEPIAARLAAVHATAEQAAALVGAAAAIAATARAVDLPGHRRQVARFHRELLACSGNDMFGGLATITTLIECHAPHLVCGRLLTAEQIRHYTVAASAVRSGDPDAAATALTRIGAARRSSWPGVDRI